MLYHIVRLLVKVYSNIYFKKIYLTGLDKLPDDRPIILACNHPTAFIEPAMVGGMTTKARNFLLRGDMFGKGKMTEVLLRGIKCIPIYRFQDGFAAMKKNEEILQYCYDLLGKGENVFILAEGVAKHEKRMRPIQKGTARMVFGAYEKHNRTDIEIVPLGLNYTDSLAFRSSIYAEFGPPIPIKDFLEDHTKNPRRAIKRLTDRLSKEMRKRIIHIEKEEDEELGNQLLLIEENTIREKSLPRLSYQPSRQPIMWEKIERMNQLEAEEKASLKEKAQSYFSQLKNLGIQDVGVAQQRYSSIWSTLALLVGLPSFLLGLLIYYIPIQIGKHYGEKAANTLEFNSALRFGFELFACLLTTLFLLLIAAIFGSIWHVIGVLLIAILSHFSIVWMDQFHLWKESRKVQSISKEQLSSLEKLRKQLSDF